MAYKGMAQINKKDLWTIPNLITYFRIICIPVYVVLMALAGIRADQTLLYVALGVFVVASASDLVDGWIARRFNMTTGIGMVLDPFADKLMHISVLFCLAFCTGLTPLGQQTASLTDGWYIHYAFVILVLAKEGFMVLMSPFVMKRGAKIQANWMGKVASATISIGVILCFFHPYVYLADWGILAWGVALSYGALIGYIKEIVHQIKLIDAGKMERVTDESVKYTNAENTALLHPVETEVAADTDSQN
ncbi:MAG: CDP-alcohol phosphatidyltransferase family protein [Clostridia bacterium]|nr:CDP-alcohol phosphatidyltransferase family protein [Clostridia bacterium]